MESIQPSKVNVMKSLNGEKCAETNELEGKEDKRFK